MQVKTIILCFFWCVTAPNPTAFIVTETHFAPIEFLDWSCLTIGALGAGQIQIANAANIVVQPNTSRREWMLTLFDRAETFYQKELVKTNKRLTALKTLRAVWEAAPLSNPSDTKEII